MVFVIIALLAVVAERRGVLSAGAMWMVLAVGALCTALTFLPALAGWALRQLLPPFL